MKNQQNSKSTSRIFNNENQALLQLKHPNIIKLYEASNRGTYKNSNGETKPNTTFAILELAQNGEIFGYLANTGKFSEPMAKFYFNQMVSAINHCHSQGLFFRVYNFRSGPSRPET